jgi:nitrite reductase/ring-hydroxylating ferredoxin subunit
VASVVVARAEEIPPGARKIVEIGGRSIGVFNLDGHYYALRNRCPHQGGPICSGFLFGALRSQRPGDYEYSDPGGIIRCPWHGWEFDVKTGRSWFDPARQRVRAYPASVEERLEAYPARQQGSYVVVELAP